MATELSDLPRPAISPEGTTIPRHIAAVLDNILAMLFSVVLAKQLSDSQSALQMVTIVVGYLAYYFVSKLLFSTTIAKFVNGLVVRNFDGGRPTFPQITIRTLMRLIEANPMLLGGLPAAARILWSRDKQRFGDKLAGTIVVRR